MKSLLALAIAIGFLAARAEAGDACPNCAARSGGIAGEAGHGAISDKSVYQLSNQWTNDYGQMTTLGSAKGRIQVVTMFFSHCSYACPLLVYKMQQLEAALPAANRSQVAFTLVSFDTERDTPAVLHDYRQSHQLGTNWTLLHGSASDVLDLAAALDVKFKQNSSGQFLHSNLITILNQDGEIAIQETGLNLDTGALPLEIQRLAKKEGMEHAGN